MAESYFDKARKTNLPVFLRSLGIKLTHQGRSYGSNYCPACGTSEDISSNRTSIFQTEGGIWRWKCFVHGGAAGSAIDYAAAHWGMSSRDAAWKLAHWGEGLVTSAVSAVSQTQQPQNHTPETLVERDDKAVAAVIDAIRRQGHSSEPKVLDYLASRGINSNLVAEAVRRGVVRMMPSEPQAALHWLNTNIGEGLLRKGGFIKTGKRWPAIAFRPLVFCLLNGGAEFRLIHPVKKGEIKSIRYGKLDFPIWWKGSDTKKVLIVEGGIDVLSAVALGRFSHVLGIPGAQAWRPEWFDKIAAQYGSDVEFIIGLDGDNAGQKACDGIEDVLCAKGFRFRREEMPSGMDWNNLLCSKTA